MSQNYGYELTDEDRRAMDSYQASRNEAMRQEVFNVLVMTCQQALPHGMLEVGTLFAVGNPPVLVVEVVASAHGLRFAVLASMCEKIPVNPGDRLNISTNSVFTGRQPKGTPRVPNNKQGWKQLSGEGSAKLLLWKFMCDFKAGVKTNILA